MEKIYEIPVNDAFSGDGGCPLCGLKHKLENDEVGIILGASMMEPDIRIKTNEKGFCAKHFGDLINGRKRLPLALMLESHIDEVLKKYIAPAASRAKPAAVDGCERVCGSCYICERTEFHLAKMFETVCILWERDAEFRKKFSSVKFFCLPCCARLAKTAKKHISKKQLGDFLKTLYGIEEQYMQTLKDDLSWFCKKFDYRFENEPWGNAKDSVERTVEFLSGTGAVPETGNG